MSLADRLRKRRGEIVRRWADDVLASYPSSGAAFFRNEADPFHNPVGATIRRSMDTLYDHVLGDADDAAALGALDDIIRIRSVQELSASQATGFVFALKGVIADAITEAHTPELTTELLTLHARLDALSLQAFDAFMACREQVWEIRARQASARVHTLLRQAGMLADEDDPPPDGGSGTKGGCQA